MMNGKCFEVGTIQAFLDGETTPEVSAHLTDHVAVCDACARLMAAADEETSLVFSALERELNTLVPTQRLWTRINDTIAVEKSRMPFWQKVLVYVRVSIGNPSIAAAAAVLLALGMFALLVPVNDNDTPMAGPTVPVPSSGQNRVAEIATTGDGQVMPGGVVASPSVNFSDASPKAIRTLAVQTKAQAAQREIRPQYAIERTTSAEGYLPGEESYVKTIAELKQNVDAQKDAVLSPSTRVSFERDMAVVNDSIKQMREVVKKNPRNQAARTVLYSSYQDKIDLLNSVAQREELMAKLR